jgi:hypothetical protein
MPVKLTLEAVKLAFESEKCTLVSKEYFTNKKPLEYLCSCGSKEIDTITYCDFQRGIRCNHCRLDRLKATNKERFGYEFVSQRPETREAISKGFQRYADKKKHKLEDVIQYFKDNKCKLLETTYKDCISPLKFLCLCGKEGCITYAKFREGQRCSDLTCMDTRKKATNLAQFGSISYTGTPEYKERHKITCLAKYGTDHPLQSALVQEKSEKSGHAYRPYTFPSGLVVSVQGYEPFGLNHLLKTYKEDDLRVGRVYQPEIWYTDATGTKHRYFSDVYIPTEKHIVEIKSTWTYQKGMKQGKLALQKEACSKEGYRYTLLTFDEKGVHRPEMTV